MIRAILIATLLACSCTAPGVGPGDECPPMPPDPVPCLRQGQSVAGAALAIEDRILEGADATELQSLSEELAERAEVYMLCSTELVLERMDVDQ